MTLKTLIRQAKVIDPTSVFNGQVVDILIDKGVIESIAPNIEPNGAKLIEADGRCVSPGWVDAFADYREPGYEQKETIETGLKAALAGGFTRVLLAPNTNPVIDNKSTVQFIQQKIAGHAVHLHPLGAISRDIDGKALAEMLDMRENGAIAFTDGWKPVQNANLMLKALEYVKAFNGTVIQIPLDISIAEGGLMHEGVVSTRLGMPGIPALAESLIVHRDIELVRYTNSKLHITGVSTAQSVYMIRKAKMQGLDITCSVTPYHLALTDEALTAYDSLYKVSPVLRPESDRKALVDALKEGTIDCIATHHRPHEWDAKAKEFEYAAEGMNIQEIAFSIMWDALSKEIPIMRLVQALALVPRDIFGLQEATIAEGSNAELTIFTTSGDVTLTAENKASMGMNNPFIGKKLKGKVIGTISNHHIHLNK